jgi:hypothetical protein
MSEFAEAREHWRAYIRLDPVGSWTDYAKQRLAATEPIRFIRTQ